jgi:hypothetical protein
MGKFQKEKKEEKRSRNPCGNAGWIIEISLDFVFDSIAENGVFKHFKEFLGDFRDR